MLIQGVLVRFLNAVMESKEEELTGQVAISGLKRTLSILWPPNHLRPHLLQKTATPPPPPPPAFSTNSIGNGQISSDIAIAITIPTIFFAVFVSASCYFLPTRRTRRKNKSAKKGNAEVFCHNELFRMHCLCKTLNS
ncbi:hypothetical protein Dsin_032974 [Dipteronia sinensis]|uniref:Uncharacterized protein n=1 Tax=Dipteronia sinensis TaxID=43782 RepID=A0AAE0DNS6_9ROSI|nr:hypothetical protein Dsin_032974 [Dipteronia sinensis]